MGQDPPQERISINISLDSDEKGAAIPVVRLWVRGGDSHPATCSRKNFLGRSASEGPAENSDDVPITWDVVLDTHTFCANRCEGSLSEPPRRPPEPHWRRARDRTPPYPAGVPSGECHWRRALRQRRHDVRANGARQYDAQTWSTWRGSHEVLPHSRWKDR